MTLQKSNEKKYCSTYSAAIRESFSDNGKSVIDSLVEIIDSKEEPSSTRIKAIEIYLRNAERTRPANEDIDNDVNWENVSKEDVSELIAKHQKYIDMLNQLLNQKQNY